MAWSTYIARRGPVGKLFRPVFLRLATQAHLAVNPSNSWSSCRP